MHKYLELPCVKETINTIAREINKMMSVDHEGTGTGHYKTYPDLNI